MNLERYEPSTAGRQRLTGRTERRGSRTGMTVWGTFLFGGLFAAAGTAIFLVGAKVIPVDPASVHAPYWVLCVCGVVFALAGVMVWGMGWKQSVSNRRRSEMQHRYPGETAMADYAWDPCGFDGTRWPRAVKALGGAGFLTLFLSIFNWWAFFAPGPWPVKVIVSLFDLVLVAVWWHTCVLLGRALKFGGSRIEFLDFPYRLGRPVTIRWWPANGITAVRTGRFTLRCVEEWYERRGSGRNRSTHLVHEEIWSASWHAGQTHTAGPRQFVELRFEPPADAPPSRLSAERPVFWELEVTLDLPGFDFAETYLVPVYGKQ